MLDRLEYIKKSLVEAAEHEMHNLGSVDAKELGEAIDMIKDLEEAIYYCTITKAMNQKEKEGGHYNTTVYYSEPRYRDMDRSSGRMYSTGEDWMYSSGGNGRMYATGQNGSSSNGGNSSSSGRSYHEYPMEMMHDYREGKSPMVRRRYMDAKHSGTDKNGQLRELESYVKELSHDVVEMIEGSSPEEKKYLATKIQALASKVQNLNDD